MSKKDKSVEVKLEERPLSDGTKETVLLIGRNEIGSIKPDGDRFVAKLDGGSDFRVKTIDTGIEQLLADYHLHRG
ncbi:DUF2969 domain-containing protein [Levilactobacillus bambusae]|uniref:DUF2969 domain-containing protein n=1 Tax=Levilactobacillus bambusae TaxID=2024736 RepID=A0A2V1MZE7_9LACO|nr:DUF2969 domain-containing protein [Levilactobacillus bambusae]PWF99534.1 DUF2969 domain-containing protein [Levilactobacillus bambusae]